MVKTFQKLPDDEFIADMNQFTKMWMFYNWLEDQRDDVELVKNHAYLLGSFWNPEAVKKLTGESGQQYSSTDEEFEQSLELVKQGNQQEKGKKRRRRKIKG